MSAHDSAMLQLEEECHVISPYVILRALSPVTNVRLCFSDIIGITWTTTKPLSAGSDRLPVEDVAMQSYPVTNVNKQTNKNNPNQLYNNNHLCKQIIHRR